jgi:hypothetical protein
VIDSLSLLAVDLHLPMEALTQQSLATEPSFAPFCFVRQHLVKHSQYFLQQLLSNGCNHFYLLFSCIAIHYNI